MIEAGGVQQALYQLKERVEKRRKTKPEDQGERLLNALQRPGKLPTTEVEASQETIQEILKKAQKIRVWLEVNGKPGDEFSEEHRNAWLGREREDFEDLTKVSWHSDGEPSDNLFLTTDLDEDLEGWDVELVKSTPEYQVTVEVSSQREFSLSVDFDEWSGGLTYLTRPTPFGEMDKDQGKIINLCLDEAIRRLGILEVS